MNSSSTYGAPFTSADVAFTWHAIMNPNTLVVTRHGYDQVDRVDTPDPNTVVLALDAPRPVAADLFWRMNIADQVNQNLAAVPQAWALY